MPEQPEAETIVQRAARRLREVRQQLRLSQENVAARLGVSRSVVAAIEQGRRPLTISEVYDLAYDLGLSPRAFLAPDDRPLLLDGRGTIQPESEAEWLRGDRMLAGELRTDDGVRDLFRRYGGSGRFAFADDDVVMAAAAGLDAALDLRAEQRQQAFATPSPDRWRSVAEHLRRAARVAYLRAGEEVTW